MLHPSEILALRRRLRTSSGSNSQPTLTIALLGHCAKSAGGPTPCASTLIGRSGVSNRSTMYTSSRAQCARTALPHAFLPVDPRNQNPTVEEPDDEEGGTGCVTQLLVQFNAICMGVSHSQQECFPHPLGRRAAWALFPAHTTRHLWGAVVRDARQLFDSSQ